MVDATDIKVQRMLFAKALLRMIRDLCKVVFNVTEDSQMSHLFGMTKKELKMVIEMIIHPLPDDLFTKENQQKLEEIKKILGREFIFFQVQERGDDPTYQRDLAHFIATFTRDIQKKLAVRE